ncbi:MAG: TRAP transporter small permease subunit [Synergistaceae bacterium]|nr:TRAP transporter small permease subunit [Synergistaceae bacterium]
MFVIEIIITLFQITSRNIIGRSYAEIEEIAIILLPWFGFFCATYTLYRGNHVQIEFFYFKMPRNLQRIIFLLTQVVLFILVSTIAIYSIRLSIRQWNLSTPSLGLPNGIRYLGFPIVTPFMLLLFGHNIRRTFKEEFNDNQGLSEIPAKGEN